MKLWILTSETEEFVGGGIGQYVENFSRAMARAGHDVLVICCGDRDAIEEVEGNLRRLIFKPSYYTRMPREPHQPLSEHAAFPYNVLHYWIALSWQMAHVVENLVRKEGVPDVIECQEHNALGYYVIEKRLQDPEFLPDTPIVLHLHSPDFILQKVNRRPLYRLPDYWRGWMEKQCIHRADSLVCPSAYMAKQVSEALNGNHPEIKVIPLPHEPDARLPERVGRRLDMPEVLYVGRLERRKGVLEAVEACSRLWNQGHQFRLRLVGGDEPLVYGGETVWERLSKRFAGDISHGLLVRSKRVAHRKLAKLRAESDILIVPSLWENFPNTAMEAMLGGATLLVSNAGGQAIMVGQDERNGLVFDWSVTGDFEDKLLRLLRLCPEERLAMGRRARTRIMHLCSPETIVAERSRHFQKVIETLSKPDRYPFWPHYSESPELVFPPVGGNEITVVIPHYNHGDYVVEAVESALGSNFPVTEVLVVDDGSDEHASQIILDQLERRSDSRVTVLRRAHAGLAATRNAGVQAAGTPFVAFLDADDRLGSGFLGRAVSLLERYANVALVSSWMQYFGNSNGVFPCWDLGFPYLLVQNQLIPVCLIRREAFLEYAPHLQSMEEGLEDWESWISLFEKGGRGVAISEPLNFYRVRDDSMLRGRTHGAWPILYGEIAARHASSFQAHGEEIAGLMASNPDPSHWHHPGLWTEWGPPEKAVILKRWQRWEKRAGRIRALTKDLYFKSHYILRSLRKRLRKLKRKADGS